MKLEYRIFLCFFVLTVHTTLPVEQRPRVCLLLLWGKGFLNYNKFFSKALFPRSLTTRPESTKYLLLLWNVAKIRSQGCYKWWRLFLSWYWNLNRKQDFTEVMEVMTSNHIHLNSIDVAKFHFNLLNYSLVLGGWSFWLG